MKNITLLLINTHTDTKCRSTITAMMRQKEVTHVIVIKGKVMKVIAHMINVVAF